MNKQKNFREECLNQNIPIISQNTENFLKLRIEENRPTRVAEIGSAVGYSTKIISESIGRYTKY